MHNPGYTEEEDRVLLSYTADLDPEDYKDRVDEFTLRFKQAALRLPGRNLDALRKRYKRLTRQGKPELTSVQKVPSTPHCRVAPRIATAEPIQWDEPFIRPPSIDKLMGRR